MEVTIVADTERQPARALDKVVASILTDRRLGQRASSQQCLVCHRWIEQKQLEFICCCSLTSLVGATNESAVKCELRTRYPGFICSDCASCSFKHSQEYSADAVAVKDEEQTRCGKQLSPDHVEAVYSLCDSEGRANLDSLKKVCPCCGGFHRISLTGCSYCLISNKCRHCLLENHEDSEAEAAGASATTTAAASALARSKTAQTYSASTAAGSGDLCPWCIGHEDTAAISWYQGCLTDQQFDKLRIPAATAAQRSYFLRLKNYWRFEQQLADGVIVILVDSSRGKGRRGNCRVYITTDGKRVKNTQEMDACLEAHAAGAASDIPSSSVAAGVGTGVSTDVLTPNGVTAAAGEQSIAADGGGANSTRQHAGLATASAAVSQLAGCPGDYAMDSQIIQQSPVSNKATSGGNQHPNNGNCSSQQAQVPITSAPHSAQAMHDTQSPHKAQFNQKRPLSERLIGQQKELCGVTLAECAAGVCAASAKTHDAPVSHSNGLHQSAAVTTAGAAANTAAATAAATGSALHESPRAVLNHGVPILQESLLGTPADTAIAAATIDIKQEQGQDLPNVDQSNAAGTVDHSRPRGLADTPSAGTVEAPLAANHSSNAAMQGAARYTVLGKRARTSLQQALPEVADSPVARCGAAAAHAATYAAENGSQHDSAHQRLADNTEEGAAVVANVEAAQQSTGAQWLGSTGAADRVGATTAAAINGADVNMVDAAQGMQPKQENPESAAAQDTGSSGLLQRRDSLVKRIDAVLQLQLMSDTSPLKESLVLHALWYFRRQYKKLVQTNSTEALAKLEVLHQFVTSLNEADFLSVQDVQQHLDLALLQSAPQQCMTVAATQDPSGSTGTTTVLQQLLLCWLKEFGDTEGMTADQQGARPATGLCHTTLQVFLKAFKMPATAENGKHHSNSLSQLSLQLAEGLSLLLNGFNSQKVQDVDEILKAQWRRSMHVCLKYLDTLPQIAEEVTSQLEDMQP